MDRRPDITDDPDPFQDDSGRGSRDPSDDGASGSDRARSRQRTRDTGDSTTDEDDDSGRGSRDPSDDGASGDSEDVGTGSEPTPSSDQEDDPSVVPGPTQYVRDRLDSASETLDDRVIQPIEEGIQEMDDPRGTGVSVGGAPLPATGAPVRTSDADASFTAGALRGADPAAIASDALGAYGAGLGLAMTPTREQAEAVSDAGGEVAREFVEGAREDPFQAGGALLGGGVITGSAVAGARGLRRTRDGTDQDALAAQTDTPGERPQTFPDADEVAGMTMDDMRAFIGDDRAMAQMPRQRRQDDSRQTRDVLGEDTLGTPDPTAEAHRRRQLAERRATDPDTGQQPAAFGEDTGAVWETPDGPQQRPRSGAESLGTSTFETGAAAGIGTAPLGTAPLGTAPLGALETSPDDRAAPLGSLDVGVGTGLNDRAGQTGDMAHRGLSSRALTSTAMSQPPTSTTPRGETIPPTDTPTPTGSPLRRPMLRSPVLEEDDDRDTGAGIGDLSLNDELFHTGIAEPSDVLNLRD